MKTGLVNYEQWKKPVKYTEEFLQSLTGDCAYEVHAEHNGGKITQTNSLYMKNGELYASFDDDVDEEGYGYSPIINFDMYDYGDYYLPVVNGNTKILSVDKVAKPKIWNNTVWNSEDTPHIIEKEDNDGVDIMSDKLESTLEENGALKSESNRKTKKINDLKDQYKKLQELNDKQSNEIEELKSKNNDDLKKFQRQLDENEKLLKQYQEKEKQAKYDLAKSVAEGRIDKEEPNREDKVSVLVDELSNLSDETLKVLNSQNTVKTHENTAPRGVSASAQGSIEESLPNEPQQIDGNSSLEDIKESLRRKGFSNV